MTASVLPPNRLHALVVDDNVDYADSLCEFLNHVDGWEAEAAYGVQEALAHAQICRPDAVLLDMQMPPETGFDAADALHRAFPGRVPVLFVVSGSVEMVARAVADGRFRRAVLKPADPAALVGWLADVALRAGR